MSSITRRHALGICASGILVMKGKASPSTWQAPQPGWLYVLDDNNRTNTSRILVIDVASGRVVQEILAGHRAAFSIAQSGTRLYVVSGVAGQGLLSIVNTATGQTERTLPVANRLITTLDPLVRSVATSPDDTAVYIEKMDVLQPGSDRYSLAVLRMTGTTSSMGELELPNCGVVDLQPGADGSKVIAHCPSTNSMSSITLASAGASSVSPVALPSRPEKDAAGTKLAPAARRTSVAVLRRDGSVAAVMADGQPVQDWNGPGLTLALSSDFVGAGQRFIPFQRPCLVKGHLLYVGSISSANASEHQDRLDEIDIFDIESGRQVGSIKTSVNFWSLAVAPDGSKVYAASPATRSVLVIDTNQGREVGRFANIGDRPVDLAVAP